MFQKLLNLIRQVVRRLVPYKSIEQTEQVETPLSTDMINALDEWYNMYRGKPEWLSNEGMKTLNLPAFIASEIARQMILELKWNITGRNKEGEGDADVMNPRAQYLKDEFEKCVVALRQKLEIGCASGGMAIKPYTKDDGHIYFDWIADWSLYPIAFDDDGSLRDVIFKDSYAEGKTYYTRLERHRVEGKNVRITQRAFKSTLRDSIGTEIPLSEVPIWEGLQPEVTVESTDGQLFGWYRVAAANNVDIECPMGVSVFSRARNLIRDADVQYSRLMWEFEGSELAIDVDPSVLRPKATKDASGKTVMEMPKLNSRLFRGVDLGKDEAYSVFAPNIRDNSILNGLQQILTRIEDQCGMSRGSLTEAPSVARTATEMRLLRQRSYATVADNQTALETCFRNVIRAMDKYATIYNLAPEGEYDVSFQWDDSIITDSEQMMNERLTLMNSGVYGKAELRQWYFGETPAQAVAAVQEVLKEQMEAAAGMESVMASVTPEM